MMLLHEDPIQKGIELRDNKIESRETQGFLMVEKELEGGITLVINILRPRQEEEVYAVRAQEQKEFMDGNVYKTVDLPRETNILST